MTVKGTLWPATRVTGSERPFKKNSEFVVVTDETVMFPPVALKLLDRLEAAPVVTLPKLRLPGATLNWAADTVPVPESAVETYMRQYFVLTENVPLALPLACGAKVNVNVTLCLGAKVMGKLKPATENPVPVMLDL